MRIGIPREIKNHEYRVALTPEGVRELVAAGHEVRVERDAGAAVGFSSAAYRAAGARIADSPMAAWNADLVVKVKEPQAAELERMREGSLLFCYLHLAAAPELAVALAARGVAAIAFETVRGADGSLPLLAPMSAIAGRLAPQMGAQGLQLSNGGSGLLVPGLPGVPPAHIVIIGGGVVGLHATRIAVGLGARVTLLDRDPAPLQRVEAALGARVESRLASADAIAQALKEADIVIGAAQIPGRHAPRLITLDHLKTMRPGSVLVDVAIDQGGIAESSRATSHSEPFFVESGVVHYCVPNMPGVVARTSTIALAHAILPYVLKLALRGRDALDDDPGFMAGLHIADKQIVHAGLKVEMAGTH